MRRQKETYDLQTEISFFLMNLDSYIKIGNNDEHELESLQDNLEDILKEFKKDKDIYNKKRLEPFLINAKETLRKCRKKILHESLEMYMPNLLIKREKKKKTVSILLKKAFIDYKKTRYPIPTLAEKFIEYMYSLFKDVSQSSMKYELQSKIPFPEQLNMCIGFLIKAGGPLNPVYRKDSIIECFNTYFLYHKEIISLFDAFNSRSFVDKNETLSRKLIDSLCNNTITAVTLENWIQNLLDFEGMPLSPLEDDEKEEKKNVYDEVYESFDMDMIGYKELPFTGILPLGEDENICKISLKDDDVYARTLFNSGDIIEICPCKKVSKESLYSREMRELAFRTYNKGEEEYVVPLGYIQYYSLGDLNANCDFIYDESKNKVLVKSIKPIRPGEKLILKKN